MLGRRLPNIALHQFAPFFVVVEGSIGFDPVCAPSAGPDERVQIKHQTKDAIWGGPAFTGFKERRVDTNLHEAESEEATNGDPWLKPEGISDHMVEDPRDPSSIHNKVKSVLQAGPLAPRVVARYSNRRAVCPAQGIGLPSICRRSPRHTPSVGAVSYGRACRESLRARRFLQSGRPIVARPATRIGLRVVGPTVGNRP